MSFLAGLLRRELAAPTSLSGSTTPDGAVVPRLASRFEDPGAPPWPGSRTAATDMDAGTEIRNSGATADAPIAGMPAAARPAGYWAVPSAAAAAARTTVNPAGTPVPGSPGPPTWQPVRGVPPQMNPAPSVPQAAAGQGTPPGSLQVPEHPFPRASRTELLTAAGTGVRRGTGEQGPQIHPSGVEPGEASAARAARLAPQEEKGTSRRLAEPGTVRPRLDPLTRHEPARAPEQHIHVHIGRIEVKAVAAPAQRPPAPEQTGLMSLDEYLGGRP